MIWSLSFFLLEKRANQVIQDSTCMTALDLLVLLLSFFLFLWTKRLFWAYLLACDGPQLKTMNNLFFFYHLFKEKNIFLGFFLAWNSPQSKRGEKRISIKGELISIFIMSDFFLMSVIFKVSAGFNSRNFMLACVGAVCLKCHYLMLSFL